MTNLNEILDTLINDFNEKFQLFNDQFLVLQSLINKIDQMTMNQEEKQSELNKLLSTTCYDFDFDLFEIKLKEHDEFLKLLKEQIEIFNVRFETFLQNQLFLSECHSKFGEIIINVQTAVINHDEAFIDCQRTKIAKYQEGPKKKSLASQQEWSIAKKYFVEEIPRHKTLKSARKEAAKRAGIFVEERQLVKMLPDPR